MKRFVVAGRLTTRADGPTEQEVRTFGTKTHDLLALLDWLVAAGGPPVALGGDRQEERDDGPAGPAARDDAGQRTPVALGGAGSAAAGALIANADGVYDPRDYNDRLLLGLHGMFSEAELHLLWLRLAAGRGAATARFEARDRDALPFLDEASDAAFATPC